MTEIIQPMPPLSAEEFDALRSDIATNGVVLVPVIKDQHGRIIDGNHRAAIATELGIDYPVRVVEVTDDADAWDRAVALNCARRHLTREQTRTIIATEIRRRPEDSDRAIARRVGCSPTSVGAVRAKVSKLDSLAAEFDAYAQEMQLQMCLRVVPLLCQVDDHSEQVRQAWRCGMDDLDACEHLSRAAAVWVRNFVWQPLDDYMAEDAAQDRQRGAFQSTGQVIDGAELAQRIESLSDWPPMMAFVLRESWPDIFTDTADEWLLSKLDTTTAKAVTS